MYGAWRSPVAHSVRDAGVGGSNPLAPTIYIMRIALKGGKKTKC